MQLLIADSFRSARRQPGGWHRFLKRYGFATRGRVASVDPLSGHAGGCSWRRLIRPTCLIQPPGASAPPVREPVLPASLYFPESSLASPSTLIPHAPDLAIPVRNSLYVLPATQYGLVCGVRRVTAQDDRVNLKHLFSCDLRRITPSNADTHDLDSLLASVSMNSSNEGPSASTSEKSIPTNGTWTTFQGEVRVSNA